MTASLFLCFGGVLAFSAGATEVLPQAATLNPIVGLPGEPGGEGTGRRPGLASTQVYSHGDPTAEEQLLLEMINRARANPTAEGQRLALTSDSDVKKAYQFFQVSGAQLQADFSTYAAQPPLAFNGSLIAAARSHSLDMKSHNFQGHTSFDGSTLVTRISRSGYTNFNALGENVYAYGLGLFYLHAGLNADWGVPSLGHRKNIMNYSGSVYREIGIGITKTASTTGTNVGPWIMTQDFGLRSSASPFLVGVVYRDNNHDGFYTIGEGLAGVTIRPAGNAFSAVTSTSGGYAIPLSAISGAVTVTASGGPVTASISKIVTLAGQNVKLDFETINDRPSTNKLPAISIISPTAGAIFSMPAQVNIGVNTSDEDGAVVKVEFFAGATKLGEDTLPPFAFDWSNIAAGTYSVTAKATDNQGGVSTSGPVTVTVNPPPLTAAVTNSTRRLGGGSLELRLRGTGGSVLRIESSTNLALPQWSLINTQALTGGAFDFSFVENGSTNFVQRFFRTIIQ